MNFKRLIAGRTVFASFAKFFAGPLVGFIACGILSGLPTPAGAQSGQTAARFPFDQELLLDVPPMRPVKRVPMLKVDANGRAMIDLWCRSVPARIALSDSEIRIETAPLPEALPQYMSAGQCSEARMQADAVLLAALAQVTGWQRRGGSIELNGPTPIRFRPSSH
jgi:hypothetical protein